MAQVRGGPELGPFRIEFAPEAGRKGARLRPSPNLGEGPVAQRKRWQGLIRGMAAGQVEIGRSG